MYKHLVLETDKSYVGITTWLLRLKLSETEITKIFEFLNIAFFSRHV